MKQYIKACKVINAPTPDHKAVVSNVSINTKRRGPGYWKLNTSILNEDLYKTGVKDIIESTKNEYENDLSKRMLWDLCKGRIKEFSIRYCIDRANVRKQRFHDLNTHLTDIDNEISIQPQNIEFLRRERAEIKQRLDEMHLQQAIEIL